MIGHLFISQFICFVRVITCCKVHNGVVKCSSLAMDFCDVFQLFGESRLQHFGRDLQSVSDANRCMKHVFKSFGLFPDSARRKAAKSETKRGADEQGK